MKEIKNLQIEKMALGGYGIGYHAGKAIFVPYTMLGDVADVSVSLDKKNHAFALIKKLHKRVEAENTELCSAFGGDNACGACDWLHIPMLKQLEYKQMLIVELFNDYEIEGGVPPTGDAGEKHQYRNKTFMPLSGDTYGFYARYSHHVVEHDFCYNHPPLLNEMAKSLMQLCKKAGVEPYDELSHSGTLRHIGFRRTEDDSQVLVILVTRSARLPFSKTIVRALVERFPMIKGVIQNINPKKGNVILGDKEKLLYGDDFITESLAGKSFRVHYRSFWQTNNGALRLIVKDMAAYLTENRAPRRLLVDAYCGIGNLGISLAGHFKQTIGIEEFEASVNDARYNALQNKIDNISFSAGKAEHLLPDILARNPVNTLILDPPRGGVKAELLELLAQSEVSEIFYLSCSPMHLKRDLDRLCKKGPYRLQSLKPYNMFPNTWHIECLAILRHT